MAFCQFCERPAEHTCAWLIDKTVRIWPSAVKPGMVCAVSDGRNVHPEVLSVELSPPSWLDKSRAAPPASYAIRVGWLGKEYVWIRSESDLFTIVRQNVPCGAGVCFAHAREVGPNRVYCYGHWTAWDPDAFKLADPAERSLRMQQSIDRQLAGGRTAADRSRQRARAAT